MRTKKGFIGFTSICLLFLISCLLFVFVNRTYAFFTDRDEALNELQMSKLDIEVDETVEGGRKKNVQVKNTSRVKSYVRVLVTVPELQGVKYTFQPNRVPNGWKEGADGYLYYDHVLMPGEKVLLYSLVEVGKDEGVEALPDDLVNICGDVMFYAEAVQSDNILPDDYSPGVNENEAMKAFEILAQKK